MQTAIVQTGARASAADLSWAATPPDVPTLMRIWTHTLAAPTTVPFASTPDPIAMAHAVAGTCRGAPPSGDFVWTTPQVVQGVAAAHILHFPSQAAPPLLFWLRHFRGRGSVVVAANGHFDWPRLGQMAYEAFGYEPFTRGAFGVQIGNKVFPYAAPMHIPPHGAIIHLVPAGPPAAATANVWETGQDAPQLLYFDYDICLGPRGERPIPVPLPAHTAAATSRTPQQGRERAPPPVVTSDQLEAVCNWPLSLSASKRRES